MFTMTDHYGWVDEGDRRVRLFSGLRGQATVVVVDPVQPLRVDAGAGLSVAGWEEPAEVGVPLELWAPLRELLPLRRIATPTLWEASATAIIRQVVRAGQARLLFAALVEAVGEPVENGGKVYRRFPTVEAMLGLSEEQYGSLGLAFHRPALQSVAAAFLRAGPAWERLGPQEAFEQLLALPGVGPWTAGVAVADWSNDFGFYPYADLAVQRWARSVAPGLPWPDRRAFGDYWNSMTQPHCALATVLVLAKGTLHVTSSLPRIHCRSRSQA